MAQVGRSARRALAGAAAIWGILVFFPYPAPAQTSLDSFQIYTDHPRLFLRPQRLRLLRRERERNSMRWDQFHLLMAGGAPMPEPGFAAALYFQLFGDSTAAKTAIAWALGPDRDLRQVALVYDWCQTELSPTQKQTLADTLRRGLRATPREIGEVRGQILAAIALAGDDDAAAQAVLRNFIENEWLGRIIPALRSGNNVFHAGDNYPLLEILHAVRDNLNADLREDFPQFFRELPLVDLLSYYPPPFPAAENEFHIPFSASPVGISAAEPDLRAAALSRAGELAMVALDTNAPESQVLQGWLMNDHFLMRGVFGITYETLWANPYQPGLSYYHVPLVLHDDLLGRLLVRSSWEDDARWAGYVDGHLQEFRDGRVVPVNPAASREPIDLDEATIFFASAARKLLSGKKEANDIFVVGLTPRAAYHVEVDDEEMREMPSDPGGILYFKGVRPETALRFSPEAAGHQSGADDRKSGEAGPPEATSH